MFIELWFPRVPEFVCSPCVWVFLRDFDFFSFPPWQSKDKLSIVVTIVVHSKSELLSVLRWTGRLFFLLSARIGTRNPSKDYALENKLFLFILFIALDLSSMQVIAIAIHLQQVEWIGPTILFELIISSVLISSDSPGTVRLNNSRLNNSSDSSFKLTRENLRLDLILNSNNI